MVLRIYTDGSCRKSKVGAWAFVAVGKEHYFEDCGREEGTTNNRQELTAVLHALAHITEMEPKFATIYTDSMYVKQGIDNWAENWESRGWKTAGNNPVKNKDLWVDILAAVRIIKCPLRVTWIKGHSLENGAHYDHNRRADEIATFMSE